MQRVVVPKVQTFSAVDTLVGGLAHDMRNPLTAIRTFVQLVRHKHDDGRFLEMFERIVLRELDRIDRIIEDLLQPGRPVRARCTTVDLATVVQQLIEAYLEHAHQHHVTLTTEIVAPLPPLVADAELLNRAFANLTLNAIEAMPQGGTLLITCRPRHPRQVGSAMSGDTRNLAVAQASTAQACDSRTSEVEVLFEDTGTGIPPEQLDRVFMPLHTTKNTGTGLGLTLTRKIIEAHQGQIRITSQIGHGTTVTMRLPASRRRRATPAQVW